MMKDVVRRAWAIFRQVAAYTSVALGAIPQLDLPASVRVPLIVFGGAILTVEHYLSSPTTPTPVVPVVPAPALPAAPVHEASVVHSAAGQ